MVSPSRDGTIEESDTIGPKREVRTVQRAKDGGTTRIVFRFEGADYEALFPAPLSPLSDATLSGEGQVWRMIREDTSQGLPTDTSYRCAAGGRTVSP